MSSYVHMEQMEGAKKLRRREREGRRGKREREEEREKRERESNFSQTIFQSSNNPCLVSPSLVPLLAMLAHIRNNSSSSSNNSIIDELKSKFLLHLSSPAMCVRRLAAKCIASFTPLEERAGELERIIEEKLSGKEKLGANEVNGLIYLVKEMNAGHMVSARIKGKGGEMKERERRKNRKEEEREEEERGNDKEIVRERKIMREFRMRGERGLERIRKSGGGMREEKEKGREGGGISIFLSSFADSPHSPPAADNLSRLCLPLQLGPPEHPRQRGEEDPH